MILEVHAEALSVKVEPLRKVPSWTDKRSMLIGMPFVLAIIAGDATAHCGRTNAAGCHTNHSTGDYHCYTPKMPSRGRANYCRVVNNEDRCGCALRLVWGFSCQGL